MFFLAPIIKKGKSYAYSFKWAKDKMENDTIMLPLDAKGNFDFRYAVKLISAIKKLCVEKVKKFIENEHKAYLEVIASTDINDINR